jgi:hypothetical protein
MKRPLATLLDSLIAKAPEEDKGAIALQLQIESQSYAGSVMHSKEHEGLYEMIVVDPNQRIAVSIFFAPESLSAVFVPKTDQEPSERRIVIPGAH